jgi:uncharacterized membrane protein
MNRIIGFDIIRTLSFIAIAIHHFNSKLWYIQIFSPFVDDYWYWRAIEVYSRSISFSGHSILFLTSFLIAFTAKTHEKALKLIPLMLVVWVLSSLMDWGEAPFLLTWDIFPLIALGLGIVWLVYKFLPATIKIVPLAGLLLLMIPFWRVDFLNNLPLLYKHILVGDCQKDITDWPVLPWVGLILFGYGIGNMVKNHLTQLVKFANCEKWIWPALLIWNPVFWGKYYSILLGDRYACEVSTQEPIVFMAHLLPFIFLMRLSLLEKVQSKLSQNRFCQFISNLQINQRFGFGYILHLLVIDLVVYLFKPVIFQDSLRAYICIMSILPLTELIMRLFFLLVKRY